jgi:hypothetical protein
LLQPAITQQANRFRCSFVDLEGHRARRPARHRDAPLYDASSRKQQLQRSLDVSDSLKHILPAIAVDTQILDRQHLVPGLQASLLGR